MNRVRMYRWMMWAMARRVLYGGCERYVVLFFFCQAEDGIRDHCVTGVQTCALPILGPSYSCSVWLFVTNDRGKHIVG